MLRKCSWTTETTDDTEWGQLGTAPGWVLGLGKGICAFKPSLSLLRASLALGASPCCLRTGLHCAKSSNPWGVALLARACAPFLPSAEREALIDLAIVGLCSELLFCKKGSCEATHAEGLTPCPEEKQQFRLWKSSPGAAYRGSKGGPAVRRGRRAVELPFPDHHDAWSLGSRQKGREVAEPGWH